MDLGIEGCCYVVGGGSRGLGRATAEALVAEGATVVLAARGAAGLEKAAAALGPDRAEGVVADLADPDAAAKLVAAARTRFGRLDGALLNVGGPPPGTALGTTDDAWRSGFESVFLGPLRLARAAADAGATSLLFALSTSVRVPLGGLAVSNGLRPGLAMTAKTLADELGPRGIRVNGILTGRFDTDRIRELDGPGDRERAEAGIPLRRYGDAAEFGRVAAFLLSPAASYVTGSLVPVDGGALRAL